MSLLTFSSIMLLLRLPDVHVGCSMMSFLNVLSLLLYFTRCFCVHLLIVRDLYFARIPDPCVFDDAWGVFCFETLF